MAKRGPRLSRGKSEPKRQAKQQAPDRRRRRPRLEDVVSRAKLEDAGIAAWLKRDHEYAEQCVKRAQAFNELARAQARFLELGGELRDPPFREVKLEMTSQQIFLGFGRLYATNEQLAEFLHGRVSDRSLNAVRVALHELRKIIDDGIAPVWFEQPWGEIEIDAGFEYVSSERDSN